ncbi:unnamed protein product [Gordionus sp. m RMFG-2023]
MVNVENLISQGKKHFLMKEYEQASDNFAEACELLAETFGEMADECAEPLYLYGKALLEAGRMENNLLNNNENDSEAEDETQNIEDTTHKLNNIEPFDDEPLNNSETLDNITNYQLAWEVLDSSRLIYEKKNDKDSQTKLADTYLKLGELSLELENYEKAISDLINCLEIQNIYLQPYDRRLAETHYNLSLSYSLLSNYDSAIKSINDAINTIKNRINYLNNLPTSSDFSDSKNEVEELEALLKDLHDKLQDYRESKERPFQIPSFINGTSSSSQLPQNKETQGKIDDVTHLVKRKTKE